MKGIEFLGDRSVLIGASIQGGGVILQLVPHSGGTWSTWVRHSPISLCDKKNVFTDKAIESEEEAKRYIIHRLRTFFQQCLDDLRKVESVWTPIIFHDDGTFECPHCGSTDDFCWHEEIYSVRPFADPPHDGERVLVSPYYEDGLGYEGWNACIRCGGCGHDLQLPEGAETVFLDEV